MNKHIKTLLVIFIFLIKLSVFTQDITGKWNGILKVQGTQLRLVLNISESESGYSSTMDSPDQGAFGMPVSSTSFENNLLKIEVSSAAILYEGTLNNKSIVVGTFNQAGQSFPLNLTKEEVKIDKKIRPQEPKKPYPYYSEEVTFENSIDEIVLAGTLTLPEKEGNYPAVILVSGSGAQNRDEELLGHKPFLVLADHLTKNGIAVLRYDDRGTSESTGTFAGATSLDFANDAESALKYLKTRKEIDKGHIGIVGHSEGGLIAPLVASRSEDVDFIVLLAGTGIRGDQLLLLQQDLIGKASGMSDIALQEEHNVNKGAFDIILESSDANALELEVTSYFKQILDSISDSEIPQGMNKDEYLNLIVNQFIGPWMVHFIKYDPSLALEKVKCPVFAINGEKDLQVPSKENLDAIKTALVKGGNNNFTTKELLNLNHLFQECITGSPSEYAIIDQTFSPLALDEISNWILKQVK